jgi:hypothetical protein
MIRTYVEDWVEEFERYSVWWTNTQVVKAHLKNVLGESNTMVSRNTFKKAPTVHAIAKCLEKRLAVAALVQGTHGPTSPFGTS